MSTEISTIDPTGAIEKEAVETGHLFGYSLNYYEQRSRDVLIELGYSEGQVEIANKVLAHWNTTVGENLARIPEELWCIEKCVDCGADVDNREFNAVPFYGVVLCRDDMQKRDEQRICTECGSRFQDPAKTSGLNVLVRPHFFFEETRHVCDWCALTLVKGDTTFIRNRGASDRDFEDLEGLTQELGLIRQGDSRFMTTEEHKKLVEDVERFEWYFDERPGVELGEKWKDYYITYTGVVIGKGDKPRPEVTTGPGWYIWHPKDESKLVWICRVRVLYRLSLSFIEIRFKNPIKPSLDIINVNEIKNQQELLDIWQGRGAVFKIREKRGTPYEYKDRSLFYEEAVMAYLRVFERNGTDQVRIEDILGAMLIKRSTYYDTAKRFGVDPDEIRQEAKSRYKIIMDKHLSTSS